MRLGLVAIEAELFEITVFVKGAIPGFAPVRDVTGLGDAEQAVGPRRRTTRRRKLRRHVLTDRVIVPLENLTAELEVRLEAGLVTRGGIAGMRVGGGGAGLEQHLINGHSAKIAVGLADQPGGIGGLDFLGRVLICQQNFCLVIYRTIEVITFDEARKAIWERK